MSASIYIKIENAAPVAVSYFVEPDGYLVVLASGENAEFEFEAGTQVHLSHLETGEVQMQIGEGRALMKSVHVNGRLAYET